MASLPSSSGIFTIPALFPPKGQTSNFDNPESHAYSLVIACAICLPLMMICVLIRFYTKLRIKHVWGPDDWLCIPATIGTAGFAGVSLSTLGQGVGPHQWDVPFTAFTPSLLRRFVVLDMLYSPTILMAKLSLLSLYLQIFRPNQALRYCIYFGMLFLTLFYAATFTAYGILSIPRPGQSQIESILSANTAKDIPLGITQGAVNVVTDFYILLLPIPGVLQLQLPRAKKIGVLAIFMTGMLACISGAFGLYYRVHLGRNDDVTWKLVLVLIWVVVELCVGVMCSSLPAFAGFFHYHLPLLRSIRTHLSSTFRSLQFSRILNRSSDRGSSEKLSSRTRNMKVTLGSRIDGNGHFLTMPSTVGKETQRSVISQTDIDTLQSHDTTHATRRDFYEEMGNRKQPSIVYPTPTDSQRSGTDDITALPRFSTYEGPHREHTYPDAENTTKDDTTKRRWWQSPWGARTRAGYWDVISVLNSRATSRGPAEEDEEKRFQATVTS